MGATRARHDDGRSKHSIPVNVSLLCKDDLSRGLIKELVTRS